MEEHQLMPSSHDSNGRLVFLFEYPLLVALNCKTPLKKDTHNMCVHVEGDFGCLPILLHIPMWGGVLQHVRPLTMARVSFLNTNQRASSCAIYEHMLWTDKSALHQ